MANNLVLSIAARQAALDAITAKINVGGPGTLVVYSGVQAASPDATAPSGPLVTLTFSATSFGAANGSAVATANTITAGSPSASGTAASFRIFSGGGTPVIDGTVGTSGCDLNLGTTTITTGTSVSITSFTLTHP